MNPAAEMVPISVILLIVIALLIIAAALRFVYLGIKRLLSYSNKKPAPNSRPIERREDVVAEMEGSAAAEARAAEKLRAARARLDSPPRAAARRGGGFATVEFDYEDANGVASHRTVDVVAVDGRYIEGWCHYAGALRTFVIGRIQGAITEAGGEQFHPIAWARKAIASAGNTHKARSRRQSPPPRRAPMSTGPEILFTGFATADRARLEARASAAGLRVRKNVTIGLQFVCAGPNAGPTKLAQARERHATVLDERQFEALLETGEIPVEEVEGV